MLLKSVVDYLKSGLRKSDLVARVGGDEFTLYMAATTQDSARVVIQKITDGLKELSKENDWHVTFSVGVITYTTGSCSIDEMMGQADKLMYSVKKSGKDGVVFGEYRADDFDTCHQCSVSDLTQVRNHT